ncbi:hypothetical protein AB0N07_44080 [Streptomyces sp. NPDC051172]|uniref:hypothetical protein n=1 Tax=Streptomyces sp. NPDC051172 TaxID=3155796 RepID=UPI00341894F8
MSTSTPQQRRGEDTGWHVYRECFLRSHGFPNPPGRVPEMSGERNHTRGRTEAVAASVQVSPAQTTAAYYLPDDLMAVAREHGVQFTDFDAFTDLPAARLKVAGARDLG